MASLDDEVKIKRAKLQIVEVLIGDGCYLCRGTHVGVITLCDRFSQYEDAEFITVIDELAVDPASPLNYVDDDNFEVALESESEATAFYSNLREDLKWY